MKKFSLITRLLLLMFSTPVMHAQTPEKPLSVGIFIYEGVEILDFSGPSEVFGSTSGFQPFLVAYTKDPVISQGFIKVTPQYSIEDCPHTDILVFPGGNTGPLLEQQKLIDWVRERAKTTRFMMSVCTGAGLLSKAGLLDGKEATTFYGFIPALQEMTPKATILEKTRFVDNGQVVTTAGVSAGIDGALHVVSKIKGEATAKATARYMEYDKWQPNDGKVIESAFMADVKKQGIEAAMKKHPVKSGSVDSPLYAGELANVAYDLMDSRPAESEAIFQWLIKNTRPTPALYNGLGKALTKMDKPAPPDSHTMVEKLATTGDVAWIKKTYQDTKKARPDWLFFSEEELNSASYKLLFGGKPKEAIEAFRWITELFPASANAWDSLAEGLEANGDYTQAISASMQCLEKLPLAGYAEDRREMMVKVSKERIERLKDKR